MKNETTKMINDILKYMGNDYEREFKNFHYDSSKNFKEMFEWARKLNHPCVPELLVDYLADLQDMLYDHDIMIDRKSVV